MSDQHPDRPDDARVDPPSAADETPPVGDADTPEVAGTPPVVDADAPDAVGTTHVGDAGAPEVVETTPDGARRDDPLDVPAPALPDGEPEPALPDDEPLPALPDDAAPDGPVAEEVPTLATSTAWEPQRETIDEPQAAVPPLDAPLPGERPAIAVFVEEPADEVHDPAVREHTDRQLAEPARDYPDDLLDAPGRDHSRDMLDEPGRDYSRDLLDEPGPDRPRDLLDEPGPDDADLLHSASPEPAADESRDVADDALDDPAPVSVAPDAALVGSPAGPTGPTDAPRSGWAVLGRALQPRVTRAQVLAGVLCALLGFALAVQIRQTSDLSLSGMRQADLVRILDEATTRGDALERERADLVDERDELLSGSDTRQAALDALRRSAETQGILAGRLPAEGRGVVVTVSDGGAQVKPVTMLNMLEELRNAGAEAMQLNDLRITASSAFTGTAGAVQLDGATLTAPYVWKVIGDPDTIATALQMPGGAFAEVRNNGGNASVEQQDLVEVSAIRVIPDPVHATPVPAAGG